MCRICKIGKPWNYSPLMFMGFIERRRRGERKGPQKRKEEHERGVVAGATLRVLYVKIRFRLPVSYRSLLMVEFFQVASGGAWSAAA
jgi:hypothetical protein